MPFCIIIVSLLYLSITSNGGDPIVSDGSQQIETPTIHHFIFNSSQESFEAQLKGQVTSNSSIYFIMGDTQFWFPCTTDNKGCYQICDPTILKGDDVVECERKQGIYANIVQQSSIKSMIKLFDKIDHKLQVKGLIINGDLTNFGQAAEYYKYQNFWGSRIEGIDIYPGLGNHDYANNVDDCKLNSCALRMAKYLKNFVENSLNLPLDATAQSENNYFGSLAYSWDECMANQTAQSCLHFIQLNNYPTYSKQINSILGKWTIQPSFDWLAKDLTANQNKSIIINFHDFDTAFTDSNKLKFQRLLEGYQILAIFFAHIHDSVGIKQYWCITKHQVPLIYSGSVPANNYLTVIFDHKTRSLRQIYQIHVLSNQTSTVNLVPIQQTARC